MLQVCPSISSFIVGSPLRASSTGSSRGSISGRSRALSKSNNTSSQCSSSPTITWIVVAPVARPPRPSSTVAVTVTGPDVAVSAFHCVVAARVSAIVPLVADHMIVNISPSGSAASARIVAAPPASSAHGLQSTRTVGGRLTEAAGGGSGAGGAGTAATGGGGGTYTLTPRWNPIRNSTPNASPTSLGGRPAASSVSRPNR